MTDESIKKLISIQENIKNLSINNPIKPEIICVSKTFKIDRLQPLINYGQIHFGENKVQEADQKWSEAKNKYRNLKLHMVGKLQTNKAKKAVEIFDYIHSLDNQKLADKLSREQQNLGKKLKYFIQVNIGNELQKSGVRAQELDNFYNYCIKEKNLNVIGLMIIPPNDNNTNKYFKNLDELNNSLSLKELSMGMSADYYEAIKNNATFVRIGSLIFGNRG